MHGIGRAVAGGLAPVAADQPAAVRLCVDRRGVWLTVADAQGGVHVNGREVKRLAMLRLGDSIFVDGAGMRLVADRPARAVPSAGGEPAAEGDPRMVLRGVGGQYHGRSFTLDVPRLVGRAAEAHIRIDDPAFALRHARVEVVEGSVVLRDLGSEDGSIVNGEPVRDVVLEPGDQLVFDSGHRFVFESPGITSAIGEPPVEARPVGEPGRVRRDTGRVERRALHLPWLLLAALLLALLLGALLLYGVD